MVARLRCFRGIDTLTSLALHLEFVGDWSRFSSRRKLAGWLGLTPSLRQSGESSASGSITKIGPISPAGCWSNQHGHYIRQPAIGVTLRNRQTGQPNHVLPIAWRAQLRLHRVHHRMRERAKPHNLTTVAVARELPGVL